MNSVSRATLLSLGLSFGGPAVFWLSVQWIQTAGPTHALMVRLFSFTETARFGLLTSLGILCLLLLLLESTRAAVRWLGGLLLATWALSLTTWSALSLAWWRAVTLPDLHGALHWLLSGPVGWPYVLRCLITTLPLVAVTLVLSALPLVLLHMPGWARWWQDVSKEAELSPHQVAAVLPWVLLVCLVPPWSRPPSLPLVPSVARAALSHPPVRASWNTKTLSIQATKDTQAWNVVVVLVPGLRPSLTTLFQPTIESTPFLASLAEQGTVLSHLYPIIPHTIPSMVPLLCGLPPSLHRPLTQTAGRVDGIPGRCLPKLLAEQGFRTAFFTSRRLTQSPLPMIAANAGFHLVKGGVSLATTRFYEQISHRGIEDRALLRPSLDWMRQVSSQKKRFFLTLVTHGTLPPFRTPTMFPRLPFPQWKGTPVAPYLNALRYQDQFLRDLFRGLEKQDLMRRTLVVIAGLYGRSFAEKALWGTRRKLSEGALRSFAVLHSPVQGGKMIKARGSHLDLPPTILSLLRYKVVDGALPGRSLLQKKPKSRPLFFACRAPMRCAGSLQGRTKTLMLPHMSKSLHFDLKEDPGEWADILFPKPPHVWTESFDEKTWLAWIRWSLRVKHLYQEQHKRQMRHARVAALLQPQAPSVPLATFGGRLALLSPLVHSKQLCPGAFLDITYRFRARRKLPKSWRLFVHLSFLPKRKKGQVSRGKARFLNGDHVPVLPLSSWRLGEIIHDHQQLWIPGDIPKGAKMLLYLGFWEKKGGRLPVRLHTPALQVKQKRLLLLKRTICED